MVKIDIIGAPTAFGQPKLGVSLGPDAVRLCGLEKRLSDLGHDVADKGNVYGNYSAEYDNHSVRNGEGLMNFEQVKDFSEHLADSVEDSLDNNRL